MLIVFEIAPEMKGCAAAIMRMWQFDREIAFAQAPAGIGAVEDRIMLGLEKGAPSSVIAPQICDVRGLDLLAREAQRREEIEILVLQLLPPEFSARRSENPRRASIC